MSLSKSTLSIVSSEILNSAITFSRSSSATRVNNVGKVEILPVNAIRQDFKSSGVDVGKQLGWLLEESSTNLCLQSEDLSTTWSVATSSQTNNTTIIVNAKESPDGNTKGDDLKGSSNGTGIVSVRQPINYNTDSKYTISVFARKGSNDYLEISNKDDATTGMTFSQVFNLNTGATGSSGGTVSSSGMQEFVNGWYRCYVTFTAVANSNDEIYFKARPDDSVSTTYSTVTNVGISIWGTQVEEKAYMTSYIPTTTTTTTRAADLAEIVDTVNMWNWNIGLTIIVDGTPLNTTENVAPIYHYQNSANTNTITLLSNGKIKVITNESSQLSSNPFDTGKSLTKDINFRNALSIKANRLHLAQNGTLSDNLPDTSITVPMSSSTDTLKFFHGTGLNSGSGWLKSVKVYSSILSDANLKVSSIRDSEDTLDLLIDNSGSVADGTITTDKLAASSVTTSKVVDNSVTIDKLNVSDGTSGQALSTDGEGTLSFTTVVSDAGGTSVGGDLSGTVSNATIVDDAIDSSMIVANAVTSSEIVDGAIITAKIADGAITSAKIGADVIIAEDLAANSITISELSDNSVTIDKLNVSDGTSGQVLSTDGSGTLSFATPSSSGKTVTESSSDPTASTNPSDGLGALYLNTTSGELFALTDATTDQNSWVNIGGGSGNIVPPQYFGDRALWMGGSHASHGYNNVNNVSYQSMPTLGSTIIWGNLSVGHGDGPGTLSNGTRALCAGGYNSGSPTIQIDYVTVASVGSSSTFGNLTSGTWRWFDGTSNGTRGIFSPPLYGNSSTQINYVTVATTGHASNFGQMTYNGSYYGWGSVGCNGSKAVHFGGYHTHTAMLYVDIATTGNSQYFGDLTSGRHGSNAFNDRTYSVCWGGWNGSTQYQSNEYITTATLGNSLAFANSTGARSNGGSCSNETRGFYKFGYASGWSAIASNIEYVTINNPSQNAIDFQNLTSGRTTVHGTSGNP